MSNISSTQPCLVETRQGFSVLYENKYLYSKYSPKESIKKVIDNLTILPNTLILCFSPVLGYGLEKLFSILPENTFVIGIERDKNLYDFSKSSSESIIPSLLETKENFLYINFESPLEIAKLVNNLSSIEFPKLANFKRALPIEFSGGVQLYLEFYKNVVNLVDDSISQFWKNRTTLIKLGRLYAGNFFKNLKDIATSSKDDSFYIHDLKKLTKNKTLLVLGTGISLDNFLPKLKDKIETSSFREKLFIIVVDASLPVVLKYNIFPDLVVGVEGQLAIEKAYIGSKNTKINFASDLLSRPSIKRILNGKNCFFISKYTNENFFEFFSQIASKLNIPVIEPLGSVGLVALELALFCENQKKIYCCGLDFSFIPGKTHGNGAPVHTNILSNCNKLFSTEQFSSSFNETNFFIQGLSSKINPGNKELTSKALFSYGQHFIKRYSRITKLYNLGDFGMLTKIPSVNFQYFFSDISESIQNEKIKEKITDKKTSTIKFDSRIHNSENDISSIKQTVKDFLSIQHEKLTEIKEILIGNKDSTNLRSLLQDCGYLYLHFPDGEKGPKLIPDFLKRIRAEVEYFLKITDI